MSPSAPNRVTADDQGESSAPGVYLVGSVAGTPLIKWGFNALPLKIVEWIANDLKGEGAGSGALKKARRGQPRSVALIADQQNF